MKVSFVIPALNEEGIVGKTIKSIPVDEIEEAGYDLNSYHASVTLYQLDINLFFPSS